jgi:hypothetical protein
MPVAAVERVFADTVFRAMCYPHRGHPLLPAHQLPSRAEYNSQFHVWCAGKDGAVTIRDAREAEMGTGSFERVTSTPMHALDVVNTLAFPRSFARCILAVPSLDHRPYCGHVWVGYSDGIVRVFEQQYPFALVAEIGVETNKAQCNHLSFGVGHGGWPRLIVGAFGDDYVVLFNADDWRYHARLLGHNGAVNAVSFLGDSAKFVSAADDGTLCLWDQSVHPDAPIAINSVEHPHALKAMVCLPLSPNEAELILDRHGQHLPASHADVPRNRWVQLWVGAASGYVSVYLLPACTVLDDCAVDIVSYFAAPIHRLHRKSAVTGLSLGPLTTAGSPTILGSCKGSTKTFRYDALSFSLLPALTAQRSDANIGPGAGAYTPCTVSTATLMPVWALDADGRLTCMTLERAGESGSIEEQRATALAYRAGLERATANTLAELADYSRFLLSLHERMDDPVITAAAAETRGLVHRRRHLRDGSAAIVGRQAEVGIIARFFRNWITRWSHWHHQRLRGQAMALLRSNDTSVKQRYYEAWAVGSSILKVKRVRREAAARLLAVVSRAQRLRAFDTWLRFRVFRAGQRKIARVFALTSTSLRRQYFGKLRDFTRQSLRDKRRRRVLDVIHRQSANGLRHTYLRKWIEYFYTAGLSASFKRTAERCVATLCTTNDRGQRVMYFHRWRRYLTVAAGNRARRNAAQFLIAGSARFMRAKYLHRWQHWARTRVQRRATSGANSVLMRLTVTGMRRAYFNKWRNTVTMRRAVVYRTASADGALWFVAHRSRTAMRHVYFRKWLRFAQNAAGRQRNVAMLETMLRHSRLGRLFLTYRTWLRWREARQRMRQRERTAALLGRTTSSGLRRQFFHQWLRYPAVRRSQRRRDALLQTMGRTSTAFVRAQCFRKWRTLSMLSQQLREASKFMKDSGVMRTSQLRSVYFGKWLRLLTVRVFARRNEMRHRRSAQQSAEESVRQRVAALTARIAMGRNEMICVQADTEELYQQRKAVLDSLSQLHAEHVLLEEKATHQQAKLDAATTKVKQYVYTLKAPNRAHPVDIASGWKDAWLDMDTCLVTLMRRVDTVAVPYPEYHAAITGLRNAALALRTRISIDVAEHLALRKEPPQPLTSTKAAAQGLLEARLAARARSQSLGTAIPSLPQSRGPSRGVSREPSPRAPPRRS